MPAVADVAPLTGVRKAHRPRTTKYQQMNEAEAIELAVPAAPKAELISTRAEKKTKCLQVGETEAECIEPPEPISNTSNATHSGTSCI